MSTSKNIKLIYLDWNIIVHFIDGHYPELLKVLQEGKSGELFSIPYTAEHVEEASNIKSRLEIDARLDFLSELTGNLYFENSILNTGLVLMHPRDVKKIIEEVSLPAGFLKWIAKIISRPMLMMFRKSINVNPMELNNIPPDKVWEEIDRKILECKKYNKFPLLDGSPIKGMIKVFEDNALKSFATSNILMGVSPYRSIASDRKVTALYSMLETFGYFPEKKNVFEKGSRFADSSHCYYSQWAEICISLDKGFRNKSKAISALTGSHVCYLSPEEAISYISNIVSS